LSENIYLDFNKHGDNIKMIIERAKTTTQNTECSLTNTQFGEGSVPRNTIELKTNT